MDVVGARTAARQALDGLVRQQAAVIAFERVFALTGIALAFTLPLVRLMRQNPYDDHPHAQPAAVKP